MRYPLFIAFAHSSIVNGKGNREPSPSHGDRSGRPGGFAAFAGGILCAILIIAPFLRGGFDPKFGPWIAVAGAGAGVLWILDLLIHSRLPGTGRGTVAVCLGLILWGWVRISFCLDGPLPGAGPYLPVYPWIGPPGSLHARQVTVMIQVTMLLVLFLLASDLCRQPRWRLWFGRSLAWAGFAVALLGIAQKVTRAPGIYWMYEWKLWTFFGPFAYHGTAGAFLNATWPAGLGFLLAALYQGRVLRVLAWLPVCLLPLGAVFLNISKAGMVVAVVMLITFGVAEAWAVGQRLSRKTRLWLAGTVLAMIAGVASLIAVTGWKGPETHWRSFLQNPTSGSWRIRAYAVGVKMIASEPIAGWGPGGATAEFALRARRLWKKAVRNRSPYLHNDYLQIIAEWGILAGPLWGFLLLRTMAGGISALRQPGIPWESRRRLIVASALLALAGAALHALVDYPMQVLSVQLCAVALGGICLGASRESS